MRNIIYSIVVIANLLMIVGISIMNDYPALGVQLVTLWGIVILIVIPIGLVNLGYKLVTWFLNRKK